MREMSARAGWPVQSEMAEPFVEEETSYSMAQSEAVGVRPERRAPTTTLPLQTGLTGTSLEFIIAVAGVRQLFAVRHSLFAL